MRIHRYPEVDAITILRSAAEDVRLSRGARGLLVEIMGLPLGGSIAADDLADRGPDSPDSIQAYLDELTKFGYIQICVDPSSGREGARITDDPSGSFDAFVKTQKGWRIPTQHQIASPDRTYGIADLQAGCVKIGYTTNVKKRLDNLQTGYPKELTLIWQAEGGLDLEGYLHDVFKKRRMRGEWFDFGDCDPAKMIKKAASAWRGGVSR